MRRRVARGALALALGASLLSGCAPAAEPEPTPSSDILTRELAADVSASGVVLAAVLMKVGDIEAAVSEGLVTPAEVEEARAALRDGTLELWKQRAESN